MADDYEFDPDQFLVEEAQQSAAYIRIYQELEDACRPALTRFIDMAKAHELVVPDSINLDLLTLEDLREAIFDDDAIKSDYNRVAFLLLANGAVDMQGSPPSFSTLTSHRGTVQAFVFEIVSDEFLDDAEKIKWLKVIESLTGINYISDGAKDGDEEEIQLWILALQAEISLEERQKKREIIEFLKRTFKEYITATCGYRDIQPNIISNIICAGRPSHSDADVAGTFGSIAIDLSRDYIDPNVVMSLIERSIEAQRQPKAYS